MTKTNDRQSPEVEELTARLDSLLVTGLGNIRHGRADEALIILQEALKTAQQLPKKEPGGDGS